MYKWANISSFSMFVFIDNDMLIVFPCSHSNNTMVIGVPFLVNRIIWKKSIHFASENKIGFRAKLQLRGIVYLKNGSASNGSVETHSCKKKNKICKNKHVFNQFKLNRKQKQGVRKINKKFSFHLWKTRPKLPNKNFMATIPGHDTPTHHNSKGRGVGCTQFPISNGSGLDKNFNFLEKSFNF